MMNTELVMLNVILSVVIMLSVAMLSVVRLNVFAPGKLMLWPFSSSILIWPQFYKTFYGSNLQKFVIS
jgi:hypothetical protein